MKDNLKKEELETLRRQYPVGTKLKCIHMDDPFHPIPPGTVGEVSHIDDAGTIHMKWQSGSSLALVPGVDTFKKVETKKKLER